MKTYLVNEIFYSIHGEGVRYGQAQVFVRFAQCNMSCGFCDTEFESYREMSAAEIVARAEQLTETEPLPERLVEGAKSHGENQVMRSPCRTVMFCGGEPLLQVDEELIGAFSGWQLAVETNGTLPVPDGIHWVTCSPKVAEHAIVLDFADELKYVRSSGQGIPRPRIKANFYLISPLFEGDEPDQGAINWCIQLVKDNPQWRLTMQHHKVSFGIR